MSDAMEVARRLRAASAALCERIAREAEMIRSGRAPNQGDAIEGLAAEYRAAFDVFAKAPEQLEKLPGSIRVGLREDAERLKAALEAHAAALSAFKDVTEGLAQALADEIARQRRMGGGYDSFGAGAGARDTGSPIALDRSA